MGSAGGSCGPGGLERQLLAYMVEHPNAQDTLEGIAAWWLRPLGAEVSLEEMERTVGELVADGLLLQIRAPDGRAHYRVNPDRWDDVVARVNAGAS